MNAVRFHGVITEDRLIKLPGELQVNPGAAEIIILQPESQPVRNGGPAAPKQGHLFDRLAAIAPACGMDASAFPVDLAENHDHFAHGAEKGLDRQ